MVVNLLESLAFILGVLILGFLLPKTWFADRFIPAGSLLTILLGLMLIRFSSQIQSADNFSYIPLIQMSVYFVVAICITLLLSRFQPVAAFLDFLSDRAKIFLYISLPVSILSLVIVILRNLVR
jgi:hypothetical protein